VAIIWIPQAAVVRDGERSHVWVQRSDDTLEYRAVTLGNQVSQGFEVQTGLKPGEWIVATADAGLQGGQTIRPRIR
jgi:multidrug efflux pump subunit AcrA (membrane-fusion protein)